MGSLLLIGGGLLLGVVPMIVVPMIGCSLLGMVPRMVAMIGFSEGVVREGGGGRERHGKHNECRT